MSFFSGVVLKPEMGLRWVGLRFSGEPSLKRGYLTAPRTAHLISSHWKMNARQSTTVDIPIQDPTQRHNSFELRRSFDLISLD
jgi:hypothetical protein